MIIINTTTENMITADRVANPVCKVYYSQQVCRGESRILQGKGAHWSETAHNVRSAEHELSRNE